MRARFNYMFDRRLAILCIIYMLNRVQYAFITKFMHISFKCRLYNNEVASIILIVFQNPQIIIGELNVTVEKWESCIHLLTRVSAWLQLLFYCFLFRRDSNRFRVKCQSMNYAPIICDDDVAITWYIHGQLIVGYI